MVEEIMDPLLEEVLPFFLIHPFFLSFLFAQRYYYGLLGHDLHVQLDNLPGSYSTPGSYYVPNNTTLAGSRINWDFENVQVFRVI